MQRVGIIGGLSPESTITYYAYLTRKYVEVFGDCSYPEIIIFSVSLEKYHIWRNENKWDLIIEDLVKAGRALEQAGATIGLIATNTMHKVYDEVQSRLKIPLINIVDETQKCIRLEKIQKVGLMGTRFTMRDDFFVKRLKDNGIDVLVPDENEQDKIHSVIENELVKNKITAASKKAILTIISKMINNEAKGIILGCTELPLLICQEDCPVKIFDTAQIHAEAVFQKMIK